MNDVTLHLGMPKTGTTSLQKQYFSAWKSIQYHGSFGETAGWNHLRFLNSAEEADFRSRREEIADHFGRALDTDRRLLVSKEECLIGHQYPLSQGYADRTLVVARLKEVFSDAQIIVVLRNQFTFLPSLFSQWQKNWYIARHSFSRWLDFQFDNHNREMGSSLNIPRYDLIHCLLCEHFNSDQVHYLLYEDFIAEPLQFVKTIANLAGVTDLITLSSGGRENSSGNAFSAELGKVAAKYPNLTRVVPQPVKRAARQVVAMRRSRRVELGDSERAAICDFYKRGNGTFMKQTGVDLHSAGYPT